MNNIHIGHMRAQLRRGEWLRAVFYGLKFVRSMPGGTGPGSDMELEELEALCDRAPIDYRAGFTCCLVGRELRRKGEHRCAATFYEEAAEIWSLVGYVVPCFRAARIAMVLYRRSGDWENWAEVAMLAALSYINFKDPKQALSIFEEVVAAAREREELSEYRVRALRDSALARARLDGGEAALATLDEALRLCEVLEFNSDDRASLEASIWALRSAVLQDLGRLDEAKAAIMTAIDMELETSDGYVKSERRRRRLASLVFGPEVVSEDSSDADGASRGDA